MITILDTVCPKPYTGDTLRSEGLGGTEATVVRIAERLAKDYKVVVQQKGREEEETINGVVYSKVDTQTGTVIVLRNPKIAVEVAKSNKRGKTYLWCHDLMTPDVFPYLNGLRDNHVTLIAVSEYHKGQIYDTIRKDQTFKGPLSVKVIYNPIDDDLHADSLVSVNTNKLVFTSSPHKGLDHTLKLFGIMRKEFNPEFELHIFNPGYFQTEIPELPGVINHGPKPYAEVIQHVRESLCLFYINQVFPETFGLVMVEANAVGTPFITHQLGAANEVSDHPHQVIDTRDAKKVIDRVMSWKNGERLIVGCKKEFRTSEVIKSWKRLLL